ncbi:Uncharacterized protein HZ326_24087 [Fusarium oxysporum f. sp. albedinis]|nr:Uncharacterized protein HZ326_24087 [Fusarium oxysporum f. sp. albedinis]
MGFPNVLFSPSVERYNSTVGKGHHPVLPFPYLEGRVNLSSWNIKHLCGLIDTFPQRSTRLPQLSHRSQEDSWRNNVLVTTSILYQYLILEAFGKSRHLCYSYLSRCCAK